MYGLSKKGDSMKYSRQWLLAHLMPKGDLSSLVVQLKAKEIDYQLMPVGAFDFTGVLVGEIKLIAKHPNADKLQLCQVDVGAESLLSIVCGANNIHEGMRVPVAPVGSVLPGDFKIKKAKLRGEVSQGMLCSAKELGLSQASPGILALPADATIGESFYDYFKLNDELIDVSYDGNDALSIFELSKLLRLHVENKPNKNSWLKKLLNIFFKL